MNYEKIMRNVRQSEAIENDETTEKCKRIIGKCKQRLGYTKAYYSKGGDAYVNNVLINKGSKIMTTKEMIESIHEFIADTKECMADTPSQGIAGTILKPHHILKQQIKEAEELLAKINKGELV